MPPAEGPAQGGRPPRGRGAGAPAPPWATAAAVESGGAAHRGPGDTFKDYTKPRKTLKKTQKTIQRHKILDKTKNIGQEPRVFNGSLSRRRQDDHLNGHWQSFECRRFKTCRKPTRGGVSQPLVLHYVSKCAHFSLTTPSAATSLSPSMPSR